MVSVDVGEALSVVVADAASDLDWLCEYVMVDVFWSMEMDSDALRDTVMVGVSVVVPLKERDTVSTSEADVVGELRESVVDPDAVDSSDSDSEEE